MKGYASGIFFIRTNHKAGFFKHTHTFNCPEFILADPFESRNDVQKIRYNGRPPFLLSELSCLAKGGDFLRHGGKNGGRLVLICSCQNRDNYFCRQLNGILFPARLMVHILSSLTRHENITKLNNRYTRLSYYRLRVCMLEKFKENISKLNKNAFKIFFTYEKIIGLIILIVGLLLLAYSFGSSLSLVIGIIYIDETWFVRLFYLVIVTVIGGYLTNQGVNILGLSRLLSTVFLLLGLASLLIMMRTAQVFIETYYQLTLYIILGIAFFGVMVAIFLYVTSKGVSFFLKKKAPDKPAPVSAQSVREEHVQAPEPTSEERTRPEQDFIICSGCLSKISREDSHCIHCGRALDPAPAK
jgi:hypothetical protein